MISFQFQLSPARVARGVEILSGHGSYNNARLGPLYSLFLSASSFPFAPQVALFLFLLLLHLLRRRRTVQLLSPSQN